MEDPVTRAGMGCSKADGPVTLTFTPVPGSPDKMIVTCQHCEESWETTGSPSDFMTFDESKRNRFTPGPVGSSPLGEERFVATINVPGYLPMDDDPPVFDTAQEAWDYLLGERRDAEDYALEVVGGDGYSATFNTLEQCASGNWTMVCDFEKVGTVYGDTPGYDGDHDLGLAYTVTEFIPECRHCGNHVVKIDDVWSEQTSYLNTTPEESRDMARQCGLAPDGRHEVE